MTLFCDTSALIKLLIEEPDSERMLCAATSAEWIAVCRITWAAATAAMASALVIVEVHQPLVEAAGRLADAFALRGYDSVQLAAAQQLQSSMEQPVTFACFDRRLNQAAHLLQLHILS